MRLFTPPTDRPCVGVSACLLGEAVRFDSGHKRDDFLLDVLATHFDFVPFCPEVSIGMGVPRPPIRLVDNGDAVRALGVRDSTLDVTDALKSSARDRHAIHRSLCGYILKKNSPSCGMERVKTYTPDGHPLAHTAGLFAGQLLTEFPNLPVEEEGRLRDPILCENFVTRVFVYARWRELRKGNPTKSALLQFHVAHKLLLLAHNETAYRRMGQFMADLKGRITPTWLDLYEQELMQALKRRATRKRHTNALMHVAGYFKRQLDEDDRAELSQVIDDYRIGKWPIVVPLMLLQHHLRRHPVEWLEQQVYFTPHPEEWGLRNAL